MSHQFNNEYSLLGEEVRKDPLGGLLDVVGHRSLYDHRKELFYWLERIVTCSDGENSLERSEEFFYFGLTLKCVERLHRIHQMIEAGELTYAYQPKTVNDGIKRNK
jgi:hypothetical protein